MWVIPGLGLDEPFYPEPAVHSQMLLPPHKYSYKSFVYINQVAEREFAD
jgi:hypothetical protein